jgi:glutamate decarboxylase
MSHHPVNPPPQKRAEASLDSMYRIFTIPEREDSTLSRIEREISQNLQGFLSAHVVAGEKEPHELEQSFKDTQIPEEPVFVSEHAEFVLNKVVAQSVHVSAPSFIGHMTSAIPYFMLPMSKVMMALNQNLVKIETSKAFTPLERQVIGMLHRLIYNAPESFYKKFTHSRTHSIGTFCSGGTTANVTSLWVARNRLLRPEGAFRGVNIDGLFAGMNHYGYRGMKVFISERGHYSFAKAVDLLGIGKSSLVSIPTDRHNRVDVSLMRQAIQTARSQQMAILAIVGIAGTTETGNVDPLTALADLAAENQCHFHVDAAWGGPTLLSRNHAHLLKGIERADSVCIDAHKQLYVPMGAGMALFKDSEALKSIEQSAKYVIREGSRDIGKHTLEGSRPGMALLVHSGLKIMGRKGYELLIDHGIEKAQTFAAMIRGREAFELISEPELNLLTYRFVPPPVAQALRTAGDAMRAQINGFLNTLNVHLQKAQRIAGKSFVSRTTLTPSQHQRQSVVVLRVVLANPLTTTEILNSILDEQEQLGQKAWDETFRQRFANLSSGKTKDPL